MSRRRKPPFRPGHSHKGHQWGPPSREYISEGTLHARWIFKYKCSRCGMVTTSEHPGTKNAIACDESVVKRIMES